jgi:hypothetical protein
MFVCCDYRAVKIHPQWVVTPGKEEEESVEQAG